MGAQLQRGAYSRVCGASTAFRPVAVGVGGAERGAPMSQGAYRRVCGASTPKGAAQRGCSATGPAFSALFSFRRGFRYHARMVERTLAIIKPDAVSRHLIGTIIQRYEQAGLIPV